MRWIRNRELVGHPRARRSPPVIALTRSPDSIEDLKREENRLAAKDALRKAYVQETARLEEELERKGYYF
jgi:hypothetical protein